MESNSEENNKENNNIQEYKKIEYYNENDILKGKTNMTKEIIVKNLDNLLEDIEIGKIIKIKKMIIIIK